MVSPLQGPTQGAFFYRRTKEVGMVVLIKGSMAFHWLSCDPLLWTELLPGKRRKSFFLLDSAIIVDMRATPCCFSVLFN